MIVGFKDKRLEAIVSGRVPKGFPTQIVQRVRFKLVLLNGATELQQLSHPPANHLEALQGDRAGQHSIRVNRQFRICFAWTPNGPDDVEFVDYH